MSSSYPKWKYHAELVPLVVEDEAEEGLLGETWKDSPADHGIITNPSAEQTRKMRLEAAAKDAKAAAKGE